MGSASSTTSSATSSNFLISERLDRAGRAPSAPLRVAPRATVVVSDTGQRLRAEEPRGTDEQNRDHDDEGDDGAEAAAEEEQLVLVAGGEGLGDPDEQPAHQCSPDGVQPPEDRRGEGP